MEPQSSPSQELKRALTKIIEAGFQVEPDTLEVMKQLAGRGALERRIDPALERATNLEQRPLFLHKTFFDEPKPEILGATAWEGTSQEVVLQAKHVESKISILDDPGKEGVATKSTEDIMRHFRDRFSRISSILRQRSDVRGAVAIKEALNAPQRTKNKIICIVTEKRERQGSLSITVEDTEDQAVVMVFPSSERKIMDKAQRLFLDQIVCMEVSRMRGEALVVHDIINPDIPDRPTRGAEEEVYAILLSDLHIGSNKFLAKPFEKFLDWVQGNYGNDRLRKMAFLVKYIVIAGDLVDGIGVYPGQERELAIRDICEQYSEAARILSRIPEHVQTVIVPGNHDATLQAIPQRPIPEKFLGILSEKRNVTNLGGPAYVSLHGIELLIYHGRSLDDLVGTLPNVTYQNLGDSITTVMRSLIRARHLAPIYGYKTPIVFQEHDNLVIERVPDILHCGHIHVSGYETYRGTLLLNSGTWQAQTEFQERMGLFPTTCIAHVVNLRNLMVTPIDFSA